MKEMDIVPILAGAILCEQIGGRYDICLQEARVSGIPFDKSFKQGGKGSPSLFNMMMRAFWMVIKLYKNKGIAEGRKHKRYREVVQPCIHNSCEGWSWN